MQLGAALGADAVVRDLLDPVVAEAQHALGVQIVAAVVDDDQTVLQRCEQVVLDLLRRAVRGRLQQSELHVAAEARHHLHQLAPPGGSLVMRTASRSTTSP